ncbi:non-specific lipid transfer protein GPI-anchored 2-like [Chenopodium quinoa]|uniref:non-specific lipid transfer protein GPI-anchored 2-like n=1 Tax=Chenopodium quinoa TaxID=63459 RepID=UPI000B782E83|nr:non-specific lipid transfer protein GPI-anchored 2-like [Chenopodium quinoa]
MVSPKYVMVLVLAISSMWAMSMAQPSSSGISGACTNVLVTLSPCLNYITGNSSTPSSSCCSQLGNVVKSSPECLCEVLNGGASGLAAGLNINQTQALTLPNACNVQTPPLSRCNKAASPAGSPLGSPGSGSKTSPTDGDSSDATMSKLPTIPALFAVLYVVVSHALAF